MALNELELGKGLTNAGNYECRAKDPGTLFDAISNSLTDKVLRAEASQATWLREENSSKGTMQRTLRRLCGQARERLSSFSKMFPMNWD